MSGRPDPLLLFGVPSWRSPASQSVGRSAR